MVYTASQKLANLDIEETLPLNPVGGRTIQDSRSGCRGRVMKGAIIMILFVFLVCFITLVKDANESQHSGADGDRRVSCFHSWFINAGSNLTIATHLRELTKGKHVAGTPQDMLTAKYVHDYFQQYGLAAHWVDYRVLLSYPLSRSLFLSSPSNSGLQQQQPVSLEESSSTQKSMILPFHAYAPSGTVAGEVVYVNYGGEEDYRMLAEIGVNVTGAIVIARYGDLYRGTVVKTAAKHGAIAAVLYSDPQQFGGNGSQGFFPKSKWLPPDGIQMGSVMQGMGDPSTPGWPSTEKSERISDVADKFPSIPSMPISAKEAHHILMSLSGPHVPATWRGSLDFRGVGRGPGILNFSYVENQTMSTIRNVFAVIQGSEEPDRYVLLGNHRDAWTYGAVDPNSGTAALLEIARNFGGLLRKGWQPRRSIVLCSWDAEEYGMIGSTEWVEQNFRNLGAKAVAYLNVDCAVQGPGFFAGATPQLDDLLIQVTKQVRDPDSKYKTVHESWATSSAGSKVKIDRLGGGGSDFAAFLQHAGVPSVDMYFGEFYTIWGLLALRLADDHILPFDYVVYADELQRYTDIMEEKIDNSEGITVEPITSAIKKFADVANNANQEAKVLRKYSHGDAQLVLRRRAFNDRLMLTERAFLNSQGLKGRSWFKHLVYAPSETNKYSFASFPGVVDAMANKRSSNEQGDADVQHEIWRVARGIIEAAVALDGNLT
ncbi:hypothetical protein KI387_017491 [Taxus chinensis]|uniref:Aminopeptidase NAALADL1 n=1 Tax=Taxus chinensis TaxID=29808 RepID=A0AA38LJ35_TAXCH|nr:hypothetical protein KI387_017491 [Taxus chinensis]